MTEAEGNDSPRGKYRAPALEKGLDVLELLVKEARSVTMSEICQRLGRSQGEMFRMVQVLQSRGFLAQDGVNDGYYLTDRLFTMAMRQPATQSMVELALPRMRALAQEVGQSCHLVMYTGGEIVVVARMESSELIAFSVRVGQRVPLEKSVSGTVLFGFQPEDVRTKWLGQLHSDVSADEIAQMIARADAAATAGFACAESAFVTGVHDISAPVMRGDRAAAALTIPFIQHSNLTHTLETATVALLKTTREISAMLLQGDSRV